MYQESNSYIASGKTALFLPPKPETYLSLFLVDIGGKEYRGEGSYRKSAKNRAIRAALSSFTAEDMDHLTKLREMKQRKGLQSAKIAEVVTLDDEVEELNNGEGSSATTNRSSDLEIHGNDVEGAIVLTDVFSKWFHYFLFIYYYFIEILFDSDTTNDAVLPKESSSSAQPKPSGSSSKHSDDFGDFISR